jgi:hypothetical protein
MDTRPTYTSTGKGSDGTHASHATADCMRTPSRAALAQRACARAYLPPFETPTRRAGPVSAARHIRVCVGAASVLRRCCGSGRDAVHARATTLSGTAVRRGGRAEASDSFCGPTGSTLSTSCNPLYPHYPRGAGLRTGRRTSTSHSSSCCARSSRRRTSCGRTRTTQATQKTTRRQTPLAPVVVELSVVRSVCQPRRVGLPWHCLALARLPTKATETCETSGLGGSAADQAYDDRAALPCVHTALLRRVSGRLGCAVDSGALRVRALQ